MLEAKVINFKELEKKKKKPLSSRKELEASLEILLQNKKIKHFNLRKKGKPIWHDNHYINPILCVKTRIKPEDLSKEIDELYNLKYGIGVFAFQSIVKETFGFSNYSPFFEISSKNENLHRG